MAFITEAAGNPFSLPPASEFFWLQGPHRSDAEQARGKSLEVWRPTAASRHGSTAMLRDDDLPMAPLTPKREKDIKAAREKLLSEEMPDNTFLTNIATGHAVGVVQPLARRRVVESDGEVEVRRRSDKDVRNYVQHKRDLFLVQMALDVKRAEIVRLEEKAKAKEEALAKSQKMLEDDTRNFEDFLTRRVAKAQKMKTEAENATKKNQERLLQMRAARSQIAQVQSEIGRLRETREECGRYKQFLDRLTPPEWIEQQRDMKLARKANRRHKFISERMAVVLDRLADEERALERSATIEAEAEVARTRKRGSGKANRRQQEEEERLKFERERQARRKRFQKRREEEERRVATEYEDVSSEEDYELYFKEPKQLMEVFSELEEKNLRLIQSSQETEAMLDELRQNLDTTKKDMGAKVQQLNHSIRSLNASINQERQRCEELRRDHEERVQTHAEDKKLADLAEKVQDIYVRCGLSMDTHPDTLQMLCALESQLEELIQGVEQAYREDSEFVMKFEWSKEKERRDKVRVARQQEKKDRELERYHIALQRSQAPVYKKAGKQVMYRSPPLRQEHKVAKDYSEDEANLRDHKVFGMFIDRRTQLPQTEPPQFDMTPRRSP